MTTSAQLQDRHPRRFRDNIITTISELYVRLRNRPVNYPNVAKLIMALIRGVLIKIKFWIINPNVVIGSSFRAYSSLRISGPGRVIIGDRVSADISLLRLPCILTHSKNSMVQIGNSCYLGGVRISCFESVKIGNEALLGSVTIIDSDVIPYSDMQFPTGWVKDHVKPITIGSYFWAGTNSFVLRGSTIGDECVLGAGSVAIDKEYPERSLLVGNPARRIGVTRTV